MAGSGPTRCEVSRGLLLAAGWTFFLGTLGVSDFTSAMVAALLLLVVSRQIKSGNVLRTAPVTFALVGAMLGTFTTVWLLRGDDGALAFAGAGAVTWPAVRAGELWRIPATVVLHGDWNHVLSNAKWTLGIGLLLEPMIGSAMLLRALAVTLLTSTALELPMSSGSFGESGVLYGLYGVLLTRPFHTKPNGRRGIDWVWVLAAWSIFWDLPESQYSARIGFAAHYGGLLGGVGFGCLWANPVAQGAARRTSARRLAWSMAAVATLVAVEALNPRWPLDWAARRARQLELAGNHKAAAKQWETLEAQADPSTPRDAVLLERASHFWMSRGNVIHARQLLIAVSPTLGSDAYRRLGKLQAYEDPIDDRAALASFDHALSLNPLSAGALDDVAHLRLFPTDTTLYSPEAALQFARCAVAQDRSATPQYIATLAFAEEESGNIPEGVRLMKQALALEPEDWDGYLAELRRMRRAARDSVGDAQ